MEKITTKQLKDLWIKFFLSKDHKQIDSSSVVPSEDSSVLFTTAGMQPIVPYLLGQPHPQGKRIFDYQKCIRTNDIDSVGDDSHLTFFEMLGSWSLGDYFKEQAIEYSFEFLTSKDYLNLPLDKLAVTVFEGDENCPKDNVAYKKWLDLGMKQDNIFYLNAEHNWWALGEVGPCGSDSEMYFITDKPKCSENCSPACDCGRYLEIWNDVFMQFVRKTEGGQLQELENKNIDTGMGVERAVCAINNYKSVYQTDCFAPAINLLEKLSNKQYESDKEITKAMRIICDHIRCATMILGDEIPTTPSNVGRGYVLRRLIRRSVNYARRLNINSTDLIQLVNYYIDYFKDYYKSLNTNYDSIILEFNKEITKFSNTINQGLKEFDKVVSKLESNKIDGQTAFRLYDTFGFPFELTKELADEKGLIVDQNEYNEFFKKHQELSRAKNTQVFKGGLGGNDIGYVKYHTATHLLLATLRKIYGENVYQRGSNITLERLRFDFSFDRKLDRQELDEIEKQVNFIINQNVPVTCEEMSLEQARNQGALGIFEDKYKQNVFVYTIGEYSKEICGGPHVNNTGELGQFKIVKEESSSSGVRRIKAVLK